MVVYIDGEDEVTKLIARRIADFCAPEGKHLDYEGILVRSRGGGALQKIPNMVKLGEISPVIFVFDSDGDCVLDLLNQNAPNGWKSRFCTINIAIDEGESWLMADRKGFSNYFGIKVGDIPQRNENDKELYFPYKPSLYMMKELTPKSKKKNVRETLQCVKGNKKPPTYNNLWHEYISEIWNIEEAARNSESLFRTLKRVKNVLEKACEEL